MATTIEGSTTAGRNRAFLFLELVVVALFLAYFVNLLLTSQLGMDSLFSNLQQYLLLLVMSFVLSADMIGREIVSG